MSKVPDHIWLQCHDEEDGTLLDFVKDEVTWCVDQINDSDVEYIRKDIFDELVGLLIRHHDFGYMKRLENVRLGDECELCDKGKLDKVISR